MIIWQASMMASISACLSSERYSHCEFSSWASFAGGFCGSLCLHAPASGEGAELDSVAVKKITSEITIAFSIGSCCYASSSYHFAFYKHFPFHMRVKGVSDAIFYQRAQIPKSSLPYKPERMKNSHAQALFIPYLNRYASSTYFRSNIATLRANETF